MRSAVRPASSNRSPRERRPRQIFLTVGGVAATAPAPVAVTEALGLATTRSRTVAP
eukprot:CAMPEP_0113682176 /NCGR_PEP_ID=MMETSP0038_2-20120614/12483_1 /TAXON_ID=2898 /ORGANISM="Cryptomonas paramecium" /LENGTH=55 /DNA_ID=CAMNT_0000601147 /DNA_START=89 /DNA_END=253 /DNA_ORIENTATION=- /assembly_acc=CAM_ASM_000170